MSAPVVVANPGGIQLDAPYSYNQGPTIATIIYAFYAFSVSVAFLRFGTRYFVLKSFGLDDWFMVLTVLFTTAVTITVPFQIHSGAGIHQWELSKANVSDVHKYAWLEQVFYLPALWSVKMSICGLYLRIVQLKSHKFIVWGAMAVITGHALASTIGNICLCKPQRIIWDVDVFPNGCINIAAFNYFNAVFMILQDIVLVLLPIPLLQRLNISARKKYGLIGVFAVGLMAISITIARLYYMVRWANAIFDFSGTWMPVSLCTALEIDVAMVCACLPALSFILKKLTGRATTQDYSGENGRSGSGFELKNGSNAGATVGTGSRRGVYSARIFSGVGHGHTTGLTTLGDNESEERIISSDEESGSKDSLERRPKANEVVKTVEYEVKSVNRKV